jgi:Flp pilus assembly protein TadB
VTLLIALLAGALVFVLFSPPWEGRRTYARRVEEMFSLETSQRLSETNPRSLDYRLMAGGVPLRPVTFRLCTIALGVAACALVWIFLPGVPAVAVGVVCFYAPHAWLADRVRGRGRTIDRLLPLAISRITAGILAGGSVVDLLAQVASSLASEGANPLAPELELAAKEMRSGDRTEALRRLAERSPSVSLGNLAQLLNSYLDVGGSSYGASLAEAGARMQEILTARGRAQAKAGDAVVTARIIPAALLLVLLYLSRDPLMHAAMSALPVQVVIGAAIALMAGGYLVMRSMVLEAA